MQKQTMVFRFFIIFGFLGFLATFVFSYTVKSGDTLWDISSEFFQNPFQWKDIWRANPQIANPDLIYPGDNLMIEGYNNQGDNGASNSSNGRSPSVNFSEEVKSLKKYPTHQSKLIEPNTSRNRHSSTSFTLIKEIGEKSPYLKKPDSNEQLYTNRQSFFWNDSTGILLNIFNQFEMSQGESDGIELNSKFQFISASKKQVTNSGKSPLGNAVEVTGLAKVVKVLPTKSILQLEKCYGSITLDNILIPYTPAEPLTVKSYQDLKHTNTKGEIIYISHNQRTITLYSYVIIEGGSNLGFKRGDGVVIVQNTSTPSESPQVLGAGIVVRNQANYSTILIKDIQPGGGGLGDYAIAKYSAQS